MSLPQPWCFCRSFPWLFFTWFECVSMMVILLNCVTLGMYQPCEDMDCLSDRCKILQVSRFPSCCDGASVQVINYHACFPSDCGLYLPREAGKSIPGSELSCCKMARTCFAEGNGTKESMNELYLWSCNTDHLLIFLYLHVSRGFLSNTYKTHRSRLSWGEITKVTQSRQEGIAASNAFGSLVMWKTITDSTDTVAFRMPKGRGNKKNA